MHICSHAKPSIDSISLTLSTDILKKARRKSLGARLGQYGLFIVYMYFLFIVKLNWETLWKSWSKWQWSQTIFCVFTAISKRLSKVLFLVACCIPSPPCTMDDMDSSSERSYNNVKFFQTLYALFSSIFCSVLISFTDESHIFQAW